MKVDPCIMFSSWHLQLKTLAVFRSSALFCVLYSVPQVPVFLEQFGLVF